MKKFLLSFLSMNPIVFNIYLLDAYSVFIQEHFMFLEIHPTSLPFQPLLFSETFLLYY